LPGAHNAPVHNNSQRDLSNSLKSFLQLWRVSRAKQKGRLLLRTLFPNLVNDKSGVTAIEYALIAALIAVAAIAAFTLVGTSLSTTFSTIAGQL
jgi:pilus assembly protein Flp/PilA